MMMSVARKDSSEPSIQLSPTASPLNSPASSPPSSPRAKPMRLQIDTRLTSGADESRPGSPTSPTYSLQNVDGKTFKGITSVSSQIRRLVSKEKRRFEQDGFSLDLTYVTSRIIAFGYPAESLEGLYRNHYKDVYNFFEKRHPNRYKIYNLCTERSYDKTKFHNRVSEYPFDDHCPPPISLFLPFCKDVDAWLSEHPENIAAIHCKAGKGRTGVMICAYLLYTGAWKTAHGAMEFFAAARSLKREGVTIPSQRRFISYFGEMCYPQGVEGEYEQREIELTTDEYHQIWQEEISDQTDVIKRRLLHWDPDAFVIPVLPASVYLVITSIKLNGIYANKRFDPHIRIECGKDRKAVTYEVSGGGQKAEIVETVTDEKANGKRICSIEVPCDRFLVWNEIKVMMKHRRKIGHFWFHSSFVQNNELVLQKHEIDKAVKDVKKGHQKYAPSFSVTVTFEKALRHDIVAHKNEEEKTTTKSRRSFSLTFPIGKAHYKTDPSSKESHENDETSHQYQENSTNAVELEELDTEKEEINHRSKSRSKSRSLPSKLTTVNT